VTAAALHPVHARGTIQRDEPTNGRWNALGEEVRDLRAACRQLEQQVELGRTAEQSLAAARRLRDEMLGALIDAETDVHETLAAARIAYGQHTAEYDGKLDELGRHQESLKARLAHAEEQRRLAGGDLTGTQREEFEHLRLALRGCGREITELQDKHGPTSKQLREACRWAAIDLLDTGRRRLELLTWDFCALERVVGAGAAAAVDLVELKKRITARLKEAVEHATRNGE